MAGEIREQTAGITAKGERTPGIKPGAFGRLGFSLVEVLVVIFVISLLIAAMAKVGQYVFKNAKIRTTESTMKIVCSAMEQYRDANPNNPNNPNDPFPPSPYWYDVVRPTTFSNPPGHGKLSNIINFRDFLINNKWMNITNTNNFRFTTGLNDHAGGFGVGGSNGIPQNPFDQTPNYREANISSEVLYLALMQQPKSAEVLNKLPASSTANIDKDEAYILGTWTPMIEVIDAWKVPLRYRYMGAGNFPVITSAGPDGVFDNADDIVSTDF